MLECRFSSAGKAATSQIVDLRAQAVIEDTNSMSVNLGASRTRAAFSGEMSATLGSPGRDDPNAPKPLSGSEALGKGLGRMPALPSSASTPTSAVSNSQNTTLAIHKGASQRSGAVEAVLSNLVSAVAGITGARASDVPGGDGRAARPRSRAGLESCAGRLGRSLSGLFHGRVWL